MTMDEKVEEEEDDDEMEEMNRAKHISPGDEATRVTMAVQEFKGCDERRCRRFKTPIDKMDETWD